ADVGAREAQRLVDIDEHLKACKNNPPETLGLFRRVLHTSRWPRPLRHLMWWYGLNVSGPRRAKHLGTFGISITAGLGAAALHQLSPLTIALNYGVFTQEGELDVRLTYDHRVLDGAPVAPALAQNGGVLHHAILDELKNIRGASTTKPARQGGSPLAA